MFSSALLVATAVLSGLVGAQNYSTTGPLSVDANQYPLVLRQSWCLGQTNNCPIICGGSASPNNCDPNTLMYTCTCTDGSTPNISDYTQTMPFFICEAWVANCVDNHPNDIGGQAGCHSVTCGARNASENEGGSSGSSSASSTPTSGGSGGSTASASSSSSPSSSSGAAIALNVAQSYGTGVLAVGLMALFGFAM